MPRAGRARVTVTRSVAAGSRPRCAVGLGHSARCMIDSTEQPEGTAAHWQRGESGCSGMACPRALWLFSFAFAQRKAQAEAGSPFQSIVESSVDQKWYSCPSGATLSLETPPPFIVS